MDPIKEAFNRAKQDIQDLRYQMDSLSQDIQEIKRTLISILESNNQTDRQTNQQTQNEENPTFQQINPTHSDIPTDKLPLEAVKSPNNQFSTGNRGVPTNKQTNKQTNQQTNQHIQKREEIDSQTTSQHTQQTNQHIKANYPIHHSITIIPSHQETYLPTTKTSTEENITKIEQVSKILDSLNTITSDLKSKFKKLTAQEMLVFSTIYQLQEENFTVDYPFISQKLELTETSIRDYIHKLIKKGIPLEKIKLNNKKVTLKIPDDFKKIASLSTILALKDTNLSNLR